MNFIIYTSVPDEAKEMFEKGKLTFGFDANMKNTILSQLDELDNVYALEIEYKLTLANLHGSGYNIFIGGVNMALAKEDLLAIAELTRAVVKEELEPVKADIADLKQGQAKLEQGQEQIREDMADLKIEMKMLWKESEIVDRRVTKHEREFHSA